MRTLLIVTLLLASSVSFAQTNCTKYLGGEISCTGPGGYQMEGRQHINGQTSYYDNRGNQGTVTNTLNGGTRVDPTVVGRGGPPAVAPLISGSANDSLYSGSRIVPRSPALNGF